MEPANNEQGRDHLFSLTHCHPYINKDYGRACLVSEIWRIPILKAFQDSKCRLPSWNYKCFGTCWWVFCKAFWKLELEKHKKLCCWKKVTKSKRMKFEKFNNQLENCKCNEIASNMLEEILNRLQILFWEWLQTNQTLRFVFAITKKPLFDNHSNYVNTLFQQKYIIKHPFWQAHTLLGGQGIVVTI